MTCHSPRERARIDEQCSYAWHALSWYILLDERDIDMYRVRQIETCHGRWLIDVQPDGQSRMTGSHKTNFFGEKDERVKR